MLTYKDIISGDELLSDCYEMKETYDGLILEVTGKFGMFGGAEQVVLDGANPSAEDEEEQLDDGEKERKLNLAHYHNLNSVEFTKKTYTEYIKTYMKKVAAKLEETNPERVPAFKTTAATFVKAVLRNFSDYEFFTGDSMDPDGMVLLLNYRDDGITPYLSYFKDGLLEEKQ